MKTGPALLVAGAAGLVANALVASLTVGETGFFALLAEPLRWAAALVAAGLLPVIYDRLPPGLRWVSAVVALTAVTSLFAKLVMGQPIDFLYIVDFHAVYAAVATTVFRTVRRAD
jgi:hypothetical protein